MYLKLGNIWLNRVKQPNNDFWIFVEVVDSGMSFEKPIFVRTPEQLDVWFGRSFKEHDYLTELLRLGVSLYLYKPVLTLTDYPEYIDLSSYSEYQDEIDYFNVYDLPNPGIVGYRYKVRDKYYTFSADPRVGYFQISSTTSHKRQMRLVQFAVPESLPEQGEPGYKYKVLDPDSWYIWLMDGDSGFWVSENELPQNLQNISKSLNNRDTLALTNPGIYNLPEYIYPEYKEFLEDPVTQKHLGLFSISEDKLRSYPMVVESGYIRDKDGNLIQINSDDIQNGTKSMATTEYFIGEAINDTELEISSGFKLIQKANNPDLGSNIAVTKEVPIKYKDKVLSDSLYKTYKIVNTYQDIESTYLSNGYYLYNYQKGDQNFTYYAYCPFDTTWMNYMEDVECKYDKTLTNKILTKMFMPYTNTLMWSKTIGTDSDQYSEDKNIKVKINSLGNYKYRVEVSRYDYSEYFEGSLYPEPGEKRLDSIISSNSNLIYCEIDQGTNAIRTGEFTLRGATIENPSEACFWNSLEIISRDEIYPDYILVPEINKYVTTRIVNSGYYSEYEKFLNLAKEFNCQVLFQNTASDKLVVLDNLDDLPERGEQSENTIYKVGKSYYRYKGLQISLSSHEVAILENGGDFIFNYTQDKENRLIYFLNTIEYNTNTRPGYYLYLYGLLYNILSANSNSIIYQSPVTYPYDLDSEVIYVEELPKVPRDGIIYVVGKDYYLGANKITDQKAIDAINDEKTKKILAKYKSNYLVHNNQIYYYRGYENGESCETTAWMRFAIGKLYRELQKDKWSYLSQKSIGNIRNKILSVLERVGRLSVVNDLNLTLFSPNLKENRVDLTIDLEVSDVVGNNITLDITINYNNNNNES